MSCATQATPNLDVLSRRSFIRQREHRFTRDRDVQQTPHQQPLTPVKTRASIRMRKKSIVSENDSSNRRRGSQKLCRTAPQPWRHRVFSVSSSEKKRLAVSRSLSPPSHGLHFPDSKDSQFESNFVNLGLIGSGSFGVVYKARKLADGKIYAIKRSRRSFQTTLGHQFLQEVNNIENLMQEGDWHSNVVRYFDSWVSNGHLFLSQEFFNHGTLKDLVTYNPPLREEQILQALYQLASGLEFIHRKALIHLDLKPENIFVSDKRQLKIGDFSISVHQEAKNVIDGDGAYIAPCILDSSLGEVTSAADIFSLGVIGFEMVADVEAPSHGADWKKLRTNDIDIPEDRSGDLATLVRQMMRRSPGERPSADQIKDFCLAIAPRGLSLTILDVNLPPPIQVSKARGWNPESAPMSLDIPSSEEPDSGDDLPQINLFATFQQS